MRIAIKFFILFFLIADAYGATYYMATDGSNSNDGSSSAEWLTLQYSLSSISGGDTLIIRDGIYTGSTNVMSASYMPPNGNYGVDETDGTSDDVYTIIKAENDGQVVFDGEDTRDVFYLYGTEGSHKQYIQFEGIEWCNTNFVGATGLVTLAYCDHIKFLRCGAYDAHDGDDGHVFNTYLSSYVLFEGCYSYGAGDYHFLAARDSERIIFRQCVVRHDRHQGWDQHYGFVTYGSKEIEFQNCVFVDGDQQEYYIGGSSNQIQPFAWFIRYADQGYELQDVYFRGCISIANPSCGGLLGSNVSANTSIHFENCIHLGATNGLRPRSGGVDFNHCTFGNITGTGTSARGVYFETAFMDDISNSIITGVSNNIGVLYGNSEYTCYYNNQTNYSGTTLGAGNTTTIDPLAGSLEYPIRIESGSDLDGAASDGGDIGATVLKKIGVSGTLWGETGYNTTTDEDLWPFPNEDLIKAKMAAYTWDDGSGGDPEITGARGFCDGEGQTLTKYIWEYLGNQMPSDIYSEDTTTTTISGVSLSGVTFGGN